jgi:hypothetical protein
MPVAGEGPTTGVPAVDRVLADLDRLDDLPIEEQLEAFESAHATLRAALDAPAEDGADGRSDHSA